MKIKFFILFLFVSLYINGTTQDIVLSQPFSASQFLSPAAVGTGNYQQRIKSNLRDQFMNGSSMYRTIVAGWDARIKVKSFEEETTNYFGIGTQIMSDQVGGGLLNTTYLTLNMAYHMSLDTKNNKSLSVGLGGTIAQTYLNRNNLRFGDQYDLTGYFVPGLVSADYANLKPFPIKFSANAGLLYTLHSDERFFQCSANAFYYSRPDITYSGVNQSTAMRATSFMNFETLIGGDYTFLMHASYNNRSGIQQEMIGGSIGVPVLYNYDKVSRIYAGCFVRVGDAIIPTVSMLMDKYILGFSYDIYNNGLSSSNIKTNSFEISLSASFGKTHNNLFRTLFD